VSSDFYDYYTDEEVASMGITITDLMDESDDLEILEIDYSNAASQLSLSDFITPFELTNLYGTSLSFLAGSLYNELFFLSSQEEILFYILEIEDQMCVGVDANDIDVDDFDILPMDVESFLQITGKPSYDYDTH